MPEEKSFRIDLRVTQSQKEKFKKKAKQSRMTVSEYIITALEEKPIIVVDNLPKLIAEIIRVGTNINQIAKIANSQKYINKEHVDKLVNEMGFIQIQLSDMIKKININITEKGD